MYLLAVIISLIALSIFISWYVITRDRGSKEPAGALWAAVGFGVFGLAAALSLNNLFIPREAFFLPGSLPLTTLLISMLGVGFIEEACKFVPLALFLYHKRYFNEHTDGIIYFALAGLVFELVENIIYTLGEGPEVGMLRIIIKPIFHVAAAAALGYFLIKMKLRTGSPQALVTAYIIVAVAHGIYNFGLSADLPIFVLLSLSITIMLTVSFFVFYRRAVRLDQAIGLSALGKNSFCRACGSPNPKCSLYCTRCGKYA